MSSSSDVKYLNSCVGVFTGFVHGSNPRKLDKEGQVEIVAPNPIPLELASKCIPAAEWKGIIGCWLQAICSPGDAGPSFAFCFLVFCCAQKQYWDLWIFWFASETFHGFCFSFLFKAASEAQKLIAQLIFGVFFGFMEVTLFSIQFLNHWFLPCCNNLHLATLKKVHIKRKTESCITWLRLPLGVSLGVLVWSEKKICLSLAPHFNLWTSLLSHPLWLKGSLRSSQCVFAIITDTVQTLSLYTPF